MALFPIFCSSVCVHSQFPSGSYLTINYLSIDREEIILLFPRWRVTFVKIGQTKKCLVRFYSLHEIRLLCFVRRVVTVSGHQVTSLYLKQNWPAPLSPYGVERPKSVNIIKVMWHSQGSNFKIKWWGYKKMTTFISHALKLEAYLSPANALYGCPVHFHKTHTISNPTGSKPTKSWCSTSL